MSLRIQNNVEAFNAQRQLVTNSDKLGKAMEKLSSGYRINRAGDDAAGLAISEKLRGQIGGLAQASRNASDAVSLVQTAEGALNEVHSMLQRVRELAVQYKNGTLSTTDQTAIQSEVNQLKAEIERIGSDTEFNGIKLLNSASTTISFQVGSADAQQITAATISIGAQVAQRVRRSVRFRTASSTRSATSPRTRRT
jgi:flagellin